MRQILLILSVTLALSPGVRVASAADVAGADVGKEDAQERPALRSPAEGAPGEADGAGPVGQTPVMETARPPAEDEALPALQIPAEAGNGEAASGVTEQDLPGAEAPTLGEPTPSENLFEQAVERAREALEAAEQGVEGEDIGLAVPLEALASAQLEAGDHEGAVATLQRELDLLEKYYGLYDARIARPLAILGEVQAAAGEYEESIETFQRAQHLAHRADGVYSLQQLEYLEKMSRSFIAMKKYAEADRHQRFSFFVSERKYGPDNPELVPAIMKLADWYRRVGNVRDARDLYERAVTVIENAEGKEHPDLIAPLLALGTTAAKKSQYSGPREDALKRMVAIVEAQPNIDTTDRAASWAHLGDFYVMINKDDRAADAYKKSWAILQADASLPEDQSGVFSEPRVLNFPKRIYLMDHTPSNALKGFDMSLLEYQLEIEFDLDIGSDGRILKVHAVDLDASPSASRQIRRYVREARFRPRIIDGVPVRTDGFRFKEVLTVVRPRT